MYLMYLKVNNILFKTLPLSVYHFHCFTVDYIHCILITITVTVSLSVLSLYHYQMLTDKEAVKLDASQNCWFLKADNADR